MTYVDRKIWAACRCAAAPTWSGPFGLLQPFADGVKFLLKETIVPAGADKVLFLLAPADQLHAGARRLGGDAVRDGWVVADINVGILYLFAISSLGVYGIIMGGWASNSKYPFLGALRSAAQMVSYEVSIGFVHHHGAAVRRLAEPLPDRDRRRSGWFFDWFCCRCCRCR